MALHILVTASCFLATVAAAATAQSPICDTERVSTDSSGAQSSGGGWYPQLSADGRFVAFAGSDGSLVPGDTNGIPDIFVKDRRTGGVIRASVSSSGAQCTLPNPGAQLVPSFPALSADGRFVAYCTAAADLVPGDTNDRPDVFLHDVATGQTTLVSATPSGAPGTQPSGGVVSHLLSHDVPVELGISLSGDGRHVAFASFSSDLVAGGSWSFQSDVYVRDVQASRTERVSVGPGGRPVQNSSTNPVISEDGRFVAFISTASDLVAGDTNLRADVFVRDRMSQTTTRVSVNSGGVQGNDDSGLIQGYWPCDIYGCGPPFLLGLAISRDGQFVAYSSLASNLVTPPSFGMHVFVHDRASARTSIVSRSPGTSGSIEDGRFPRLSGDGRFVAFSSGYQARIPNDANSEYDIFRFDRLTQSIERSSVRPDGSEILGSLPYDVRRCAISADGSVVAFDSGSPNVIDGDTNAVADTFVRSCREAPGTASCFATAARCPCANIDEPFAGCAHSSGVGGVLDAVGLARVSADTLRLNASFLRPNAVALFVQGTAPSTTGQVFGDGLACAGGILLRLGTRAAVNGEVAFGAGSDPSIALLGAVPAAGGERRYQVVYRDTRAYCTSSTFNTTNAVSIAWHP